jgi:hypothetical protein
MTNRTIPVAMLLGGLLDHWVARAEGHESVLIDGRCLVQRFANGFEVAAKGSGKGLLWEPSGRGDQGQVVIERHNISTAWEPEWRTMYSEGHTVAAGWTAYAPSRLTPAAQQRRALASGEHSHGREWPPAEHSHGSIFEIPTSTGMSDGIGRHSHGTAPEPRAPSALIAAMRCRVVMAFGAEVPA